MADWKLTATIYDSKNASATHSWHVAGELTPDQLETYCLAWEAVADPILLGTVRTITASRSVYRSSNQASPNSDVEEGVRVTAIVDQTTKVATFRLPTFDEQYIASESKQVDIQAVPVQTFIGAVENDGTGAIQVDGTGYAYKDSEGRDFNRVSEMVEEFQASRRK